MPLTGQVAPGVSDEAWLQHCRDSQVNDGFLSCEDGRYFLTEIGKKMVLKELKRYELRPGMMILIEQQILEAHEIAVY